MAKKLHNPSEIGKLPPQAIELEEVVLGAILLEKDALMAVIDVLKPECFYKQQNGLVYKAILNLNKRNEPFDILTVTQELKKMGELDNVGGAYSVSSLTNRIGGVGHIEHHAHIIIQKWLLREQIAINTNALKLAYEESTDVFELQENTIKQISDLSDNISGGKEFDTIASIGDEFMGDLLDKKEGKIEPAIFCGIPEIDEYGGFHNSDLIYYGARPGMGKTALIVTILRNCAITLNKPCGLFSIEMPSIQILRRIASAECGINGKNLRDGKITNDELYRVNSKILEISKAPLFIDDTAGIDIHTLCNKAKKMKRKHKIEILVIDYLGLITTKEFRNDKNNSVGYISGQLAKLKKELDIPIICLSQLNRGIESRPLLQRMPNLSDLRDSGSIEQDADQIAFLFRPQYYNDCPTDNNGRYWIETENGIIDVTDICYISYAKNRHGDLSHYMGERIGFKKEFTEFYSLKQNMLEPVNYSEPLQNNEGFLNN